MRRQAASIGTPAATAGSGSDGFGITVSYWSSLESIAAWRAHAEHRISQTLGRERWYEHFELRIARVEQSRSFRAPQ